MKRAPLLSLRLLAALALGGLSAPAFAAVKLPAVISSHMVLQNGMTVPIWGRADTGATVTVEFAGQKKTVKTDATGRWMVKLDPLPVSAEPRAMTITALSANGPAETNVLEDVLVGEVWVGSGQSNMAMTSGGYTNNDPALATAISTNWPLIRLMGSSWKEWRTGLPANNKSFSALLFSFGVRLQPELGVPVGLMVGAVGGTPSGYWLSEQAYQADPGCAAALSNSIKAFSAEQYDKQAAVLMTQWTQAVEKAKQEGKPEFAKPRLPLKPGETRAKIGNLFEQHIRPYIPFAIRGVLWDQGESGTGIGGVDQLSLMNALLNGWRKEWGQGDFPFVYVQKPSGGGCVYDPQDPVTRSGEAFRPLPASPPPRADYREMHLQIMRYTNTGMVISTDLGPGTHPVCKSGYGARAARVALGLVYGRKIEFYGPIYKSQAVEGNTIRVRFDHVGQGLALPVAVPASNAAPAKLQGFAIAGTDKVFHWADAVIDGETVVASCAEVATPVAVRYAWGDTHPWANLFNKDGLPALAFRSDNW